jgi:hypothetical protein
MKHTTILILMLFSVFGSFSQTQKYTVHTLAFYNFENLFDTIDNANYDDEWTPKGLQRWTAAKYNQKLANIAKVLSQIGQNDQQKEAPTIIGCAEIENRGVLEDLIKTPALIDQEYGIVHFDSPDKRGIDVGLLYRKSHFKPSSFVNIPLIIYRNNALVATEASEEDDDNEAVVVSKNYRVYTRDILLVTGFLDGEEINVLVNHWPSRSGGEKKSSPYREAAGKLARKIMDSIYNLRPKAKIILMGDLNDGPQNKSVKEGLGAQLKKSQVPQWGVYNPFEQMANEGYSSLFYRDSGDIFDQIMVSETLIQSDFTQYQYWKAGIFNKSFLIEKFGKYAGYPLRHSANEVGFSDHFPVYIYLIKEVH